jgi:hypothetical protein
MPCHNRSCKEYAADVDLNDPATTLALLQSNAVVDLTGFFDASGTHLTSIGIQCALCHSTVNDSLLPGIGSRLDGWANHDLDVGAIAALAPNLQRSPTSSEWTWERLRRS